MSRLALCDACGPLSDLLQKLSGEKGEEWNGALKKMLRRENPWVRSVYQIVVDYSRPLSEMIEAGNYNWVNQNITRENFPLTGQGRHELEAELFRFNRVISSEDAIKEMDEAGYRPAVLEELLALGEAHLKLQKQFSIIALGSLWRNSDCRRYAPFLRSFEFGCDLYMLSFEGDWSGGYRFLACRK